MRCFSGQIRIRGVLRLIIFGILFWTLPEVFPFDVTVNSAQPTSGTNFQTFNEVLNALQGGTLSPTVDTNTVTFVGTNLDTFQLITNATPSTNQGVFLFTSQQSDPDMFPILNHTGGDWYNFLGSNNTVFERVTFTGSQQFRSGNGTKNHSFKNCVIKNYSSTAASFFLIEGDAVSTTVFENCLIANNAFSSGTIGLGTWNGIAPVITITNCTFDNSGNVFVVNSDYQGTATTIFNCLFSGNDAVNFGTGDIRPFVDYSFTQEATGTYGDSCLTGNPLYLSPSARTVPSDFVLSSESPAKNAGITTVNSITAPSTDISGAVRSDEAGKRDIGCWDISLPPAITMDLPVDTTIGAGTSLVLRIAATGTTPLSYSWWKVGGSAEISSDDSLVLDVLASDDGTRYYCIVSNVMDSVWSDTIQLHVITLPVITDHPDTLIAFIGDSVTFSVTATGNGLTYEWLHDGETPTGVVGASTAECIDTDLVVTDGGLYTCTVTNVAGSVTSTPALLTVLSPEPQITSRTPDTMLTEGDSLLLRVTATGKPEPTYSWRKAGTATVLATTDSLQLNSLVATTGDVYRCIASNTTGKDSVDITVVVNQSTEAQFTTEPRSEIIIRPGDDCLLSITATGIGPIQLTWYKNGTEASDSIGSGTSYGITGAGDADSGIYYCIARNDYGSDTAGPVVVRLNSETVYNLLDFDAELVDPTSIRILISNFTKLPASSATTPWVDSIGIWFNYVTFPAAPLSAASDSCVKFPLQQLLDASTDTFTAVITVPLSEVCPSPLYLVAAPLWKDPDSIPREITAAQRASVSMCMNDLQENLLVLDVSYTPVADSIEITISNITSIQPDSLMYLLVEYKKGTGAYTANPAVKIFKADLPENGSTVTSSIHDSAFAGIENPVSVRVRWRNLMGNFSVTVQKTLTVGKPRPVNTAELSADSSTVESVYLHWNFTQTVVIDSIRVWWSRQQLPTATEIDPSTSKFITLPSTALNTVLTGLLSNTHYYIGVQVFRDGVGSFVPAGAQDQITTESPFQVTVPNTIKLTELTFDSVTNTFTLQWDIDTTGLGPITSLKTGILYRVGSAPGTVGVNDTDFNAITSDLQATGNTATIDPGMQLRFSSIYHFALLLKRNEEAWTLATDTSIGTVTTTPPSHQVISYFTDGSTSITAFNDQVRIGKAGNGIVNVTDTVKVFQPQNPEGFIVASIGVDFAGDFRSDPVVVALTYDSLLLLGHSPDELRMYQYNVDSDEWYLLSGDTVDPVQKTVSFTGRLNEHPLPFVVMIDTVEPQVALLSDPASSVQQGVTVKDTLVIADNVANSSVNLYYWNTYETGSQPVSTIRSEHNLDTVITSIPGDSVISDWGVKAKLVIYDGRFTIEQDISRSVLRSTSDPVVLEAGKWTPVITTAHLADSSIEGALRELSPTDPWTYDSTLFIIYRWYNLSSPAVSLSSYDTTSKWIEYSGGTSSLFTMSPGKVIWVKTLAGASVQSLGSGTTVPLKDAYTIPLKSRQWNDVALPFKFNITIGDVITATDSLNSIRDSLYVYKWVDDDSDAKTPFITVAKYLSTVPGLDSLSGVFSSTSGEDGEGTYSILNLSQRDVELRIPPVPARYSLFKKSGTGKKKAVDRWDGKGWSVSLTTKTAGGTCAPVYCGYIPGDGVTGYPVSPAFNKQRVIVLHPSRGTDHGHLIQHRKISGGFLYRIEFVNEEKRAADFSCSVTPATVLPENYRIGVYDPSKKAVDLTPQDMSLSVPGETRAGRWLLVGDSAFIAGWSSTFAASLSLLKVFPNPCRGEISIRYMLPDVDIRTLQVAMFDQLGRRVWSEKITHSLSNIGINTLRFNPGKAAVGAGTYILRLTAIKRNGTVYGHKQQRILVVP
ncbi:MAG: immunoglobulin domain-containing protein [Chitinispirillaceae bacterium]|nr:immunoglobulin domain-containing protein [Chitinispirillaceae bacterium]